MGAQSGFGDEHAVAKALARISQAAADAGRLPAAGDEDNTDSDSSVSDHE